LTVALKVLVPITDQQQTNKALTITSSPSIFLNQPGEHNQESDFHHDFNDISLLEIDNQRGVKNVK
jgi:hypothetical protein